MKKMVAVFFGDGEYDDMTEEVWPHSGQTFLEAAQERADEIASYRKAGVCGWGWDVQSSTKYEDCRAV